MTMSSLKEITTARAIHQAKRASQLHRRLEDAQISAMITAFGMTFCGVMSFFHYWLAAMGFTVAVMGSIMNVYLLMMIERKHTPRIVVRDDEIEFD